MLKTSFSTCLVLLLVLAFALTATAQNTPPIVTNQIADFTEYVGAAPHSIDLTTAFADSDVSAAVRLTTVLGTIDVALFGQQKPITVANFLNYLDQGRYFLTDPTTHQPASSFIHRSVPSFVIQGGGYIGTVNTVNTAVQPTAVATFPAIQNEPGISNKRGTIAMAKQPNNPNSATSQWFINLADNGGPPNNLDTQNGGFTVFGRLAPASLTVLDALAAVPVYNFSASGPDFANLPLRNWTSGAVQVSNLVSIPGFSRISPLTFSVMSNNAAVADATVSGTNLLVAAHQVGSATFTVAATDLDGATVSQNFTVTVVAATPTPTPSTFANISTRLRVETGDNALIGGFIVTGTQAKRVIVRAIGPSLPFPGNLADPILELRNSSGVLIRSNDNWRTDQEAEIIATGIPPTNDLESAIVQTLPAGGAGYTAIVRGVNNGTGIGLVEVYDLDTCGLVVHSVTLAIAQETEAPVASVPSIISPLSTSNEQNGSLELPSRRYHWELDTRHVTYTLPALDQTSIKTTAPNQVGVNRPVELSSQSVGQTFTNPDGTRLLILTIQSPGAKHLRVHFDNFDLPAGDEVYLHAPSDNHTFAGPYKDTGPWGDRTFWSSSIDGDTVIVEYHIHSTSGSFRIPEISHIYSDLQRTQTDPVPDVLACEVDASCSTDINKNAVGRILFIQDAKAFVCTGTLLNDGPMDQTPYFLTANHCVPTQTVAETVETYWFYQTTTCNSGVLRSGIGHSANGANLLVTSSSKDFALLRLVDTPPGGVAFSGWTSASIPVNTAVYGLHHPGGDTPPGLESYLRRAQGPISPTSGSCPASGLLSGYLVDWTSGLVEEGSSGSGLWYTGGLIGVASCVNSDLSCTNRHALYSKFSDFYSLVQPYINASTNYTITTTSSPSNGGTTSGGGTFAAGTSHTVRATANGGYTFLNWTENGSVVSTSTNYTFTLNSNRNLVANFVASISYTISTSSSPAAGGAAIGSGTFSAGSLHTVTAIANCGYSFVNWTENSSVVSTSTSYTFTLNNNRNLVAHFVVSQNPPLNSKLANISTRGLVQTGDNVLIAGTIVLGQASQRVIIRAIGPSLNLAGKLADPILELRDGNGGLIQMNDNWRTDQEAEIIATTIPPTNDLESAIVVTLPSNGASYTAIVRGVNGTTGVAVAEIYALN